MKSLVCSAFYLFIITVGICAVGCNNGTAGPSIIKTAQDQYVHIKVELTTPESTPNSEQNDTLVLQGKISIRNISNEKIMAMDDYFLPMIYYTPDQQAVVIWGLNKTIDFSDFNFLRINADTLVLKPGQSHECKFDLHYPIREQLKGDHPLFENDDSIFCMKNYEDIYTLLKKGEPIPDDMKKDVEHLPDLKWDKLSITVGYSRLRPRDALNMGGHWRVGRSYFKDPDTPIDGLNLQSLFGFEISANDLIPFFEAAGFDYEDYEDE